LWERLQPAFHVDERIGHAKLWGFPGCIELSIYEALEEHVNWWASETDLTCERLRPLL
jgi:hypothetical protein